MPKLSKEMLGLAGEYAVASELCRRGLYSQLTLGNHKRIDILVETEVRMIRISVKTKQGAEWPSISGPVRADDFLVFVDFASKGLSESLDFYVLGREEWDKVVQEVLSKQKEKGNVSTIQDGRISWPDGWVGLNIKSSHLSDYKSKWDTITSAVSPEETEA